MKPDGTAADPTFFSTLVSDWQEGDEFLAGAEARRFRILAIDPTTDETREVLAGVWIVEAA